MSNNNINNTLKSLEALYLKGDFQSAIELQKKEGEAFSPGHLYYNLGSLYLKKGDMATGRYYLELSKKHGFDANKVSHNLNIAKNNLEVKELGLEDGFFNNSVNNMLQTPGSIYLSLTLILTLISLLLFRKKYIRKKLTLFIVLLISILPFCLNQFYISKINFAVALEVTEIFEGPSGIFQKIGSIRPGEKVVIGEESNGWLYVSYPKNLNGWVNKDKIGRL